MSRFTPLVTPPNDAGGETYWFVFRDGEILVRREAGRIAVPCCREQHAVGIRTASTVYLGMLDERHCYACEAEGKAAAPEGMEFLSLRALVLEGNETLTDVAGRAMQIKEWDRTHRYFGSQPWPFPHALVMAFHAEYVGGVMRADQAELEEARWFSVDALPELPEGVHISRQLIDAKITALAK